jgi:hypothetical protein
MRVRDLREVLRDIQRVFRASGAKAQETAFSKLSASLQGQDNRDLEACLKAVEDEIHAASLPPSTRYLRRLDEIGLDERAFKDFIENLESDRSLAKTDFVTIVERYTGSADRRGTVKKLIKQLKSHFFAKLYERDANELAKRATPV